MADLDLGVVRSLYLDPPHAPTSHALVFDQRAAIRDLAGEVDRLRAENAALAAALEDIAGMSPTYGKGTVAWVATAECSNMGTRCCWEHLGQPDGGPDEWCPVCVAEVAWCAWKMGVLA